MCSDVALLTHGRDELRVFYSRDELDSVIDKIIAKEEDHDRTVKGLFLCTVVFTPQCCLLFNWRPSRMENC